MTPFQQHIQEGIKFMEGQEWEKALSSFSQAEILDAKSPVPHFFKSLSHFVLDDLKKSKSEAEQGLVLNKSNTFGYNLQALHAFRNKNPNVAIKLLKQHGMMEHPRIQAFFLLEIEKQLMEMNA